MRRIRVPSSLERIAKDMRSARSSGMRGGVMVVPPIETDLNAWEALASVQQDALIASAAEDRGQQQARLDPVGTDPADVSRHYKPGSESFGFDPSARRPRRTPD